MSNMVKFKISETSLRYGIYNNYAKGHTASVETELNQSSNPEKWRHDIYKLREYKCRLNDDLVPEGLIEACKKSEKNKTIVTDVFIFDNILVNGVKLDVHGSFCMYIKEEISATANVLNADSNANTHLGRQMIHYPISFDYRKDGLNINNREILEQIMKDNGNYAFVVKGFIYDIDSNTLNFLITLVGPNGILQTSVFKEGKGVGVKLKISDDLVFDENVIVTCKQDLNTGKADVEIEQVNRVRSKNGELGEEYIYNLLKDKLLEDSDLFHTSKLYKFSPYDIEYLDNGVKKYVEVKSTQSDKEVFNLSSGELKFMEEHKDNYILYMVTNVKSDFPKHNVYTYYDIMKMKKVATSYRITV